MYSVCDSAQLCGVSPSTLRAWERRYGVVEPVRSKGGYRVYDDAALRRLIRMSSLIASGWTPRQAASYVMSENGGGEPLPLGARGEEERPDPVPPTPREQAEHIKVILRAAAALDAPRVCDELDFVFSIHSFDDLVDSWLGPVLKATHRAWQRGRLSVAGEHFLRAGIESRLANLYQEAGHVRGDGPRVVIGTPRGARHCIVSYAFATCLRRNGCQVTYLGADVPPPAWLHAVETGQVDVVAISVPTKDDARVAAETVALLTRHRPELPVYIGGSVHARATAAGAVPLDGEVTAWVQRIISDHADQHLEELAEGVAQPGLESSTRALVSA